MRQVWFSVGIAGFIVGVAGASLIDVPFFVFLFVGILACAIFFYGKVVQRMALAGVVSLFLICLLFGGLRVAIATPAPDLLLKERLSQEVTIAGVVAREPDQRESSTLYTIEAETIRLPSVEDDVLVAREYPISSLVLVRSAPFPQAHLGDYISVTGILDEPEPFLTDTGRMFRYDRYLAKEGIEYTVSFGELSIEERGKDKPVLAALFSAKDAFLSSVERIIPEPEAALLGGVLLGTKQSLGDTLQDAFTDVGLIHIVVLSGYNVTIIAIFFRWVLERLLGLPRKSSFILSIVSIGLFAILVGLGATVVRASIMAILAVTAYTFGKTYQVTRALLLAGVLMVLLNPHILLFDISFQLSFLATIGLIYGAPYIERYLRFVPRVFELRYIVSATLVTQLFVLPILLTQIGKVSLIAPIANILVLPIVPVVMLVGFVAGMVGMASSVLAMPLAWVTYFLLYAIVALVEFLAGLPFASVVVPPLPPWGVALVYVLSGLGFGYVLWRRRLSAVSQVEE